MKNRILFSFALAMMASSSFDATGIADTTQVHGINEMIVDGQPQFAGLYSHPVADFYEMEYVDHVEVLRGRGDQQWLSDARLHRHGRCEGKILTKKVSQQ